MALVIFTAGCSERREPQQLSKVTIDLGGRKIPVELARTKAQRQFGMKYRKELAPDEGMLFVFLRDKSRSFYMKDTHCPLSIAFIRSDGVILNIAHMQPLSLSSHRSRLPCRFALEMPQGWFAENDIKEGDPIGLPADLDAED